MKTKELKVIINHIIDNVEKLIPLYLEIKEERDKANGNVALCIIDHKGAIHGKVFGDNKMRGRESFRVAWTKASQVWITGFKTGEYEQKLFNNEIVEDLQGIRKPDLIGWEGGQPITLADGTILAVGFSGFRGATDLEIMLKACQFMGVDNINQLTNKEYQLI